MDNNNREVLLKVEHLSQYFRNGTFELKAVDDVSFDVYRGEVFGLVGESGCGKTTTGRTIMKLYNATKGSVYFKGERIVAGTRNYKDAIENAKQRLKEYKKDNPGDAEGYNKLAAETSEFIAQQKEAMKVADFDHKNCDKVHSAKLVAALNEKHEKDMEAAKNRNASAEEIKELESKYKHDLGVAKKERLINEIQMIFQDPIGSLDPRMTVRDIIAEGLIVKGVKDKKYIDEQVYIYLEKVGLVREHAGRYPHEFSGGQRQRIGIARAVVMQPEMIIADEPISALDVSIQAQVINLLNDLRERLGLTIMFIAHDLSVVKYFSDRIGVMYFGKLVELADSDELFKNPLHPYTRSLLSAIPLPDPVYEKQRTRIHYNPLAEHDYSVDMPSFREIAPGHFVHCNDAEEASYKQMMK